MKNSILTIACLSGLAIFTACDQQENPEAETVYTNAELEPAPPGATVPEPVPEGTTATAGPDEPTAAAADNYPLTTCVVSGEPLGSMGEPVTIQHEGRTVKFCCKACIDDFNENPEKYLTKLDQAPAQVPAES